MGSCQSLCNKGRHPKCFGGRNLFTTALVIALNTLVSQFENGNAVVDLSMFLEGAFDTIKEASTIL
jgi:hypothetical protein